MAYSPAAILTLYFPDDNVAYSRLSKFYDSLAVLVNKNIQAPKNIAEGTIITETSFSKDRWTIMLKPRSFLKIDIFLWVRHFDGKNENICFKSHHYFFHELIKNHIVDVVAIPKGLPKKTFKLFNFNTYENEFITGRTKLVTLELIQRQYFSEIEDLVKPTNNYIKKNWDQICNDLEIVTINSYIKKNWDIINDELNNNINIIKSLLLNQK